MVRAVLILATILTLPVCTRECYAAWPIDGVVLPGNGPAALVADGRGGMLFAYTDTTRVFLGRLEGSGIVSSGYPLNVATAPSGMLITHIFLMVRDAEEGI